MIFFKPKKPLIFLILTILVLSVTLLTSNKNKNVNYKCSDNSLYVKGLVSINENNLVKLHFKDSNTTSFLDSYYIDENYRKYYLYCLDDIYLSFGDQTVTLKESLIKKQIVFDEIIEQMTFLTVYYDGGTKIYQDNKKNSDSGFNVLMCQTISGNKDVYIGPLFMEYEQNFCK